MKINIVSTVDNAKIYASEAKKDSSDIQKLWDTYMIEPYWPEISKWAPIDQSFKKPSPVFNLQAVEKQLELLSSLPLAGIEKEFNRIADTLTPASDDNMTIWLYPHCNDDVVLKEKENGVRGTVVFGNIILAVNPLADNYMTWLPYVFAHEYHHNVWGYNKYVLQRGENVDGSFLEYMLTEGQADFFAKSMFPELSPKWLEPIDPDIQNSLWERIKTILSSTDHSVHHKYMFGDEREGLPWCVGYIFGYSIVAKYARNNPDLSFVDLINTPYYEYLTMLS